MEISTYTYECVHCFVIYQVSLEEALVFLKSWLKGVIGTSTTCDKTSRINGTVSFHGKMFDTLIRVFFLSHIVEASITPVWWPVMVDLRFREDFS